MWTLKFILKEKVSIYFKVTVYSFLLPHHCNFKKLGTVKLSTTEKLV